MDQAALKRIICAKFLGGEDDPTLTVETQLLEEGICDSLGLVQLAAELERRVPGLKIKDQEITPHTFGSIASIMRLLASKSSQ